MANNTRIPAAMATAVHAAILRSRGMAAIIAYLQIARDCLWLLNNVQ
jgi:hypothetical protein